MKDSEHEAFAARIAELEEQVVAKVNDNKQATAEHTSRIAELEEQLAKKDSEHDQFAAQHASRITEFEGHLVPIEGWEVEVTAEHTALTTKSCSSLIQYSRPSKPYEYWMTEFGLKIQTEGYT